MISASKKILVWGTLLDLLTVKEGLRREYPYSVGDIRDGCANNLGRVILDLRDVILHARHNEK